MDIKNSKKILIVEDNNELLALLKDKVVENSFQLATATNGDEALEKFVAEKPDLILLDIVIPGKNGFEVLKEIRRKYKSNVPVIVMSNLTQDAYQQVGKDLHVAAYIIKSDISLSDLFVKIHGILSSPSGS